jgi:predicted DsbA family dithiol-disulfide isomerase
VGKRKLEQAISRCPDVQVEVEWKPFFLRPDTPSEGSLKPPDTPDNPRVGARMKAAGRAVMIDFTGKSDRAPNTLLAHTLLAFCEKEKGIKAQNELQELLFQAYFTDGVFLDQANLLAIAERAGLDRGDAQAALENTELKNAVLKEAGRNSRRISGGVPFFLFDGQPAFSGAQDPEAFINIFEKL